MINIARQIYAGWDSAAKKYDLPEAEVVPNGTSSNEKKKLERFTKSHQVIKEYDNIPLPGFTLYKTDRKNWGSQDQSWLVIDPRGFLVRISNDNLEDILYVTGITEGLIQQKCVWARDDSQTKMQLVPTSSSIYIEAVENTELIEGKISIRDVQIGDKVMLQNKLVGTYLGTQSLYAPISEYPYFGDHKPQVFLRRQIIEVEPRKFHYQTDLKVLKVIDKTSTPIEREDAIAYMNDCIKNHRDTFFTSSILMNQSYYSTRGMIRYVSATAVPKLKMTFEEITPDEAMEIYKEAHWQMDIGKLLLEDSSGDKHLISFPYSARNLTPIGLPFETIKIKPITINDPVEIISNEKDKKSIYSMPRGTSATYTLDNFAKIYKIVKHVKDGSYI